MADTSIIGALRIVLGTDTAAWEDGLNKAQTSMQKMVTRSTAMGVTIGNIISHMAERGFEVLKDKISEAAEHIQDFGNRATKLGVTTEVFSALAYAANQADMDLETFTGGFGKMEVALDKARSGTGTAAEAFQRLGVSQTDLARLARDPQQALEVLADKFTKIQDPSERAALATAIFGRKAGPEMYLLLQEGSKGIEELTARAAKMGVTFSKDAYEASQRFDEKMKDVKASVQGLGIQMAAGLLPVLNQGISAFQKVTEGTQITATGMELLRASVRAVVAVLIGLVAVAQGVGSVLNTTSSIFMRLMHGDFDGAVAAADTGMVHLKTITAGTVNSIKALYTAAAEAPAEAKGKGLLATDDESSPPVRHAKKIKKHADEAAKALEELKRDLGSLQEQLMTPEEHAMHDYVTSRATINEALKAHLITIQEATELMRRANADAMAVLDPIKAIDKPHVGTFIWTPDTIQTSWDKVREGWEKQREKFSSTFGKTFADGIQAILSGDFGGWLKNFWHNILNSALQGLGKNIGESIFGVLNKSSSGSILGGSGGGSSGGGWLNSIFGGLSKLLKFQHGGSFKVGGGLDNQLVMFRANEGERVDVTPEGSRPAGSVTQHFHVNAQGAVMAEGLIKEMQNIGINAAMAGARMGEQRSLQTLGRQADRRLGQSA